MKQANILGAVNTNTNTYSNNKGYSEHPNYMSSVIQSYSTTVLSHSPSINRIGEPEMTFDLDSISKIKLNF